MVTVSGGACGGGRQRLFSAVVVRVIEILILVLGHVEAVDIVCRLAILLDDVEGYRARREGDAVCEHRLRVVPLELR